MNPTNSVLTTQQTKTFSKVFYENDKQHIIFVKVRYDDQCGNGHNTFAITGEIWRAYHGEKVGRDCLTSGCIHEEIAKHFPSLAPLFKWHLCSSDGPMHYIANTVYHASERDHWGLRKGEFRQHLSRGPYQADGVKGVPLWRVQVNGLPDKKEIYAKEKPAPITVTAEWVPVGRIGEGKVRDLAAARSCAIWPDATDEDLTAPGLKERLQARLPQLMIEFRQAVESLGFVY